MWHSDREFRQIVSANHLIQDCHSQTAAVIVANKIVGFDVGEKQSTAIDQGRGL